MKTADARFKEKVFPNEVLTVKNEDKYYFNLTIHGEKALLKSQ